jgi:hypothetical protein
MECGKFEKAFRSGKHHFLFIIVPYHNSGASFSEGFGKDRKLDFPLLSEWNGSSERSEPLLQFNPQPLWQGNGGERHDGWSRSDADLDMERASPSSKRTPVHVEALRIRVREGEL